MRRVLLTGGAGYIGRHILLALHAAGWQPVVFDNLSSSSIDALPPLGIFVQGDICDRQAIAAVFAAHAFEAVIHTAAVASVPDSVADPDKCYAVNCQGTQNLLSAAKQHKVRAFVFSSTAAVYAPDAMPPFSEKQTDTAPISPYGKSKLEAEQHIAAACDAQFKACVLRYANVAGADAALRAGDCKTNATTLIQTALNVAFGHAPELVIYGTDHPTPDGTAVRDYIHVSDIAAAHCHALDYLAQDATAPFSVFNLGVGQGHSVRTVVQAVERAIGHALPQRVAPARQGDPPISFLDPTQAHMQLGWTPQQSSLNEIVTHAAAWAKKHRGQT